MAPSVNCELPDLIGRRIRKAPASRGQGVSQIIDEAWKLRVQGAARLCSKCEGRFEFDEELGQFSLPVGPRLLEHALQMDAHSREPDAQFVGHKLQAMAFQHKKSDPRLRLRQIVDVAEVAGSRCASHSWSMIKTNAAAALLPA
jgi:hypothetical protein